MRIHACSCNFNYGLTDEKWEVEEILTVFGRAERKLFLVDGQTRGGLLAKGALTVTRRLHAEH